MEYDEHFPKWQCKAEYEVICGRFPPRENLSYRGGKVFTAHLAFHLLNGFVLFSLAGQGLIICVF